MDEDLVTRLRHVTYDNVEALLWHAAAEIELLRAAGDGLYMHLDAHYGTGSPYPEDVQKALDAWKEARQ